MSWVQFFLIMGAIYLSQTEGHLPRDFWGAVYVVLAAICFFVGV